MRNAKTAIPKDSITAETDVKRKRLSKTGKAILLPLCFCALVMLPLIMLFSIYTRNLKTMVNDESYSYLEEIAAQINTNMKDRMSNQYSVLDTFGRIIERNRHLGIKGLEQILDQEKEPYGYQAVAILDSEGNLYSAQSGKFSVQKLLPFIATMKEENRPITSDVIEMFDRDCTVFISPLKFDEPVDGIVLAGVIAVVDMEVLSQSLSLSVFDHRGFAHVILPSGKVVLRAVNENSDFKGYNLLTYLESNAELRGISSGELGRQLRAGQSGRIRFVQPDGIEMFAFYAPANYENWYLFAVIPSDILTARTNGFVNETVIALIVLALVFVALLAVIILSQKQKKRDLLKMLHRDAVTGGRSMFKFEQDITAALQNAEDEFSLVYANAEKFKLINEQLGRVSADHLLREIYEAFQGDLDEKNSEYVARLMADHFGILIHTQDAEEIRNRITRWNEKIKASSLQINAGFPVVMSYGVVKVNRLKSDVAVVLDKANIARKSVRSEGDLRISYYDESLKQKIQLEQELEAKQESALAGGEFQMYLQPKYDPRNNTVAGAEALVRWLSPERGMLYPDQYIPLFESNGFIVKVDLFIFEEACRFIDGCIRAGEKPIPISVNLSRINLNQPNFMERFASIWQKYRFDIQLLEFEITESLIFDNMELLGKTIEEIHKYGFKVSMDDFGSGYSSLNMLKNVNIDVIKLDRQFFMGEEDAQKGRIIVATMIKLCEELGIHVVAEGVESEEQVVFLRQQNCDLIQGYYYARPMTIEQFLIKWKEQII